MELSSPSLLDPFEHCVMTSSDAQICSPVSGCPRLTVGSRCCGIVLFLAATCSAEEPGQTSPVDFNQDIRPILSNSCLTCHGPDPEERQGGSDGLRLDVPTGADGALADLGGYAAIVPGDPDASELIARITSDDPDLRMPPAESGEPLSDREIDLLREWIRSGAEYATHWSYAEPVRPELPAVGNPAWVRNAIDSFILARLDREGLAPTPEADRTSLIRRVALDLTGLPPTIDEVDEFLADEQDGAYERMVDRMLAKDAYGEHMARMWLDLARYADSAGYADDPPRTIWAYRDYVIRAFNRNLPFDQFTIEQIAGDLLPEPTEEQLIATAFHRNTLTNNEGGTNDEEFRNVAIVDRVNTTLAVWMGTTVNCAQCHSHKYDPISQEEYFRLFAFFNQSQDADRRDESPLIQIYTDEQRSQETAWRTEIASLEQTLRTHTPPLAASQKEWEARLRTEPEWRTIRPSQVTASEDVGIASDAEGVIQTERPAKTAVFTAEWQATETETLTALRLETLADESLPGGGPGHASGNFVVTRVLASITPPDGTRPSGRYVRIELPGSQKMLSLAEVQVFSGADNVALKGTATQSSTAYQGPPELAIDGNTDGRYREAASTTHTAPSDNPWWELDLQSTLPVDRIAVWNRTDNNLQSRLNGFRIALLDEDRNPVWEQTQAEAPLTSVELPLSGVRGIAFAQALADHAQPGFEPAGVLDAKEPNAKGWAVGGALGRSHALTLIAAAPIEVAAGSKLSVVIEQLSPHVNHTLGRFRLSVTDDARAAEFAGIPTDVAGILQKAANERNADESQRLAHYYLTIAPALQAQREQLAKVRQQLAEMKPYTTVPVMRDLPDDQRRTTKIQLRGNYLVTTDEVSEGIPEVFHDLPEGEPLNRLALAKWLVARDNPLTARVMVNRFWEKLFGTGLVATSEEFGSQGELPSHPKLLDWLAVEFMESGWDMKAMLQLIVTSATYRQSSRVTPELIERDPDNRLLARGPRFRLPAETIRDQALFVSGLLSPKMYGPPVRPPQPSLGVSAAFGSGIDWQTSEGEDRYRRGLYTNWRRSNPYPSMVAFDAPNREVCTLKRDRTNTPLQALVTLNDPVYVEAAQALARRIAGHEGTLDERVVYGFRRVLAREPNDVERGVLLELYEESVAGFAEQPEAAMQMATDPLGPAPEGMDVNELAAWTVVGNVLLNLDETFLKR